MTDSQVDIKENDIFELSPELLTVLLKDHTLSTPERQVNIFWATDNYADRGAGYQYADEITVEKITLSKDPAATETTQPRNGRGLHPVVDMQRAKQSC